MFPKEPPSKEMIDAIMKANEASGNQMLGPLPRCEHGMIGAVCSACLFKRSLT